MTVIPNRGRYHSAVLLLDFLGALSDFYLTATAQTGHPPLTDMDRTATAESGEHHDLTALDLTATAAAIRPVESTPVAQSGLPWPMFRGDAAHTAVTQGVGNIDPTHGPVVRWTYQLVEPQTSPQLRWASGFPLGDLDGAGYLDIIIASYDGQVYALGGSRE